MNLQQHYDLIGQILKERPELGSYELINFLRRGEAVYQVIKDDYQKLLRLVSRDSSLVGSKEEILWQLQ